MAKNNYIRGAHGHFAGSTGGGGFATTGAPKAGGKRGIVARARLRVALRRHRERQSEGATPSAKARTRRAVLTHLREVRRVEKRGGADVRAAPPPGTKFHRIAQGGSERSRFSGNKTIVTTRNASRPKLDAAAQLRIAKFRVTQAHAARLKSRAAADAAERSHAERPSILREVQALSAKQKSATRERAFQNRVKALRRALARTKS